MHMANRNVAIPELGARLLPKWPGTSKLRNATATPSHHGTSFVGTFVGRKSALPRLRSDTGNNDAKQFGAAAIQPRILNGTCQQGGNLTNFPILNSQFSFEGAGVQPFPVSRIHSNSRSLG